MKPISPCYIDNSNHYEDPETISASKWLVDSGQKTIPLAPTEKVGVTGVTLNNLKKAVDINREVKRLLPFGSPNQWADLVGTQAETWLRHKSKGPRFATPDTPIPADDATRKTLVAGAGNCGEHADIAYRLAILEASTLPVMQVKAQGFDHTFVVIGDHRASSAARITVVDPWPIIPIAHTLNRGDLKIGEIIRQHPVNAPQDDRGLFKTVSSPTSVVENYRISRGYPGGDALINRAIRDPLNRSQHMVFLSTPTPNTIFFDRENATDTLNTNQIVKTYADEKSKRLDKFNAFIDREADRDNEVW